MNKEVENELKQLRSQRKEILEKIEEQKKETCRYETSGSF